ncbi:hypothetical protein [Streptomyces sp. NPDC057675]|uniref:hypothetical protein n=1 Tax=Streptomyces sp. NPDC057675 TaxID=3346204 RepID=UPI00367F4D7A
MKSIRRAGLSLVGALALACTATLGGTGTAQAASGTKCSSWANFSGSSALMRACINSGAGDYGWTEVYNPYPYTLTVGMMSKLYDMNWYELTHQDYYVWYTIGAGHYQTITTPYVSDTRSGPESVGGWAKVLNSSTSGYASVTENWT